MNKKLEGKHVAILATDGFEQVELTGPKQELEQAGEDTERRQVAQRDKRRWELFLSLTN